MNPNLHLLRVILVVGALAVYGGSLGYDFVGLDDPGYVTDREQVGRGLTADNVVWAFTTTAQANWHPLTWLSLMLDAELSGGIPLDATVFRLTNLLLHAANGLLLFQLLWVATRRAWPSFLVAALFVVHPLHVESVAWVAERKDVLSTLFWLVTLLAWVRYVRRPSAGRYGIVVIGFAFGLLAKPMLVTLPLTLLLLDYWPLGRIGGFRALRSVLVEKVPLFLISIASGLATLHAQSTGGAVMALEMIPFGTRLANAAVSYVAYLQMMFWPTGLAVPYPYQFDRLTALRVGAAAFVLIAVTVLCLRQVRLRPYLTAGWLWYGVTLLPVIGLLQVGAQSMADRYTYVPLIGPFVMVVWGVAELLDSRVVLRSAWLRGAAVAASIVLVVLAATARRQTRHWRNAETLFEHALAVTENNAPAHAGLGLVFYEQGRLEEAERHYREAVEISPDSLAARVNYAALLSDSGRIDAAVVQYREALRHHPGDRLVETNLGDMLIREGRLAEAVRFYDEVVSGPGDVTFAHRKLGSLHARSGNVDAAVTHFETALRAEPDHVDTLVNLALVWIGSGESSRGAELLERAVSVNPDDFRSHKNLGVLRAREGRIQEALVHFEAAVRLDPGDEGARKNLERARSMLGAGS